MSELDKLEKYLKKHGYEYKRRDIKETAKTYPKHTLIVDGAAHEWRKPNERAFPRVL